MAGSLADLLERILSGPPLGFEEARSVAALVLDGGLGDAGVAALLVALRARGETGEVVAGFAAEMRARSLRVEAAGLEPIDTAGTGGDRSGTLNASTAAALVAASGGAVVAKHGNRSVSSRSGSADFLDALGHPIGYGPGEASCLLRRAGFAFLYAPKYHPALARVMPVRRLLGIRTVFNLAAPLSNPALVSRQVIGVASRSLLDAVAGAASVMGYRHALVVHGEPGIDEVSVSGETIVYEVRGSRIERYRLGPADLGVSAHPLGLLRVEGPGESAERFLAVVKGAGRREDRDFIAANAGAALYVAGLARDLRDGVELALQLIGDGVVYEFLGRLGEACRECLG